MSENAKPKSNLKTGLMAASIAVGMVGMGFAAVPLYRIFCQVTGFGGTTMRVSEAQAATIPVSSKTIVIRFDANQRGVPWEFKPERPTDTVSIGARDMSIYLAKNLSDISTRCNASALSNRRCSPVSRCACPSSIMSIRRS
jgi:cytochrome c oxidase assembly protein subunit 11